MSNIVGYKSYFRARIETEFWLDPEDFLWCEDDDELWDAVVEYIRSEIEYGDVIVEDSESDIDMIDFRRAWRHLKGLK